jgi:hypothetical protein
MTLFFCTIAPIVCIALIGTAFLDAFNLAPLNRRFVVRE